MRQKLILTLVGVMAVLVGGVVVCWLGLREGRTEPLQIQPLTAAEQAETSPVPTPIEPAAPPRPKTPIPSERPSAPLPSERPLAPSNKADRLAQIREIFRALAAGDPKKAMLAAKQLTDETERETALLALVTEWKHGELDSPRRRAWAIATFGLEAGLGIELAHNPDLAVLWADELTDDQGRAVVLEHAAMALLPTDPAGAAALSRRLPAGDHPFFDSVFANWAQQDTDAALQYAGQISDPTERDAAIKAIQSVAPVGIGAELRMQDGLPVINRLLAGTPAELSGQLHPGDRILAMAQGNNAFVDASGMPLSDIVQAIRGVPGSLLQLKVLPADAPPDSAPVTVAIVRGQIKFKR